MVSIIVLVIAPTIVLLILSIMASKTVLIIKNVWQKSPTNIIVIKMSDAYFCYIYVCACTFLTPHLSDCQTAKCYQKTNKQNESRNKLK